MAVAAKKARGAKIYIGTQQDSYTGETWTQIKRAVSFDPPGPSSGMIDATALEDTTKQKLKGIIDNGKVSLGLRRVHEDAGQIALLAAANADSDKPYNFKIELSDNVGSPGTPTTYKFKGFAIEFGDNLANPSALIDAKATIEVTGAVTLEAAT